MNQPWRPIKVDLMWKMDLHLQDHLQEKMSHQMKTHPGKDLLDYLLGKFLELSQPSNTMLIEWDFTDLRFQRSNSCPFWISHIPWLVLCFCFSQCFRRQIWILLTIRNSISLDLVSIFRPFRKARYPAKLPWLWFIISYSFYFVGVFISIFSPVALITDLLCLKGLRQWRRGLMIPWLILYGILIALAFAVAITELYHKGIRWPLLLLAFCCLLVFSRWRHLSLQYKV